MTATPIATVEDLMRALDENPEWVEALRVRLLTRELLELPQRFTEMAAATAEMQRQFAVIQRQFAEMQNEFAEMRREFAEMRSIQQRLQDDVSPIKGAHARNVAIENAVFLAQDMGLRLTRILSREDLAALLRAGDAGDTPANVIRSFRNADLVMETADESGADCYVALEVSYTANGRDTIRSVRNAGLLARLTGKSARAAVAGFRLDNEIRSPLDSGEVFWHQLDVEAAYLPAE